MHECPIPRTEEELQDEPVDSDGELPFLGTRRRIERVRAFEPRDQVREDLDGANALAPAPVAFGQDTRFAGRERPILSGGDPAPIESGLVDLSGAEQDLDRVEPRIGRDDANHVPVEEVEGLRQRQRGLDERGDHDGVVVGHQPGDVPVLGRLFKTTGRTSQFLGDALAGLHQQILKKYDKGTRAKKA